MSLFVQQLILGHSLKSGKLISSHSSLSALRKAAPSVLLPFNILVPDCNCSLGCIFVTYTPVSLLA